MRLVLGCWLSDLHGREESSRIRAFLVVSTMRIASYAAAVEASAVLVQAGARAIAAAVPADALGIAAGDLSVVGVLSAVACIDSTMHRRCVRRWRWLAFVSLWAGFCGADSMSFASASLDGIPRGMWLEAREYRKLTNRPKSTD